MAQYLEDLVVGEVCHFGHYEVTREEVIDFARKFDPQPFHLDDAAAAKTHFGRIAASGWHSGAMSMAMLVEHFNAVGHQGLGSPGIDELRWLKPVYPGDTLRMTWEVLEVTPSRSKPDRGSIRTRTEMFNQHDECVMRILARSMVARRF